MTASDGTLLPGVTVTLTGIAAPQVFVTTGEGDYRFLGLHPGRYVVEAELAGFSKVKRTVDVTLGKSSQIDLALSQSVSEELTVTASTPVIDTRNTATGQTIDRSELDNIPNARDPWVVLQTVPAVLVDRVNVGGNESGQQSYFVGKGVERHQTEWNIDGVAVSDMATTGSSAFYYDFDSFDEMQIATGSTDPSVRTPGVHLNMVTKRGTNDLQGSARYFITDKNFQSDAPEGNSIDHIDDFGAQIGGPLKADKIWLWGAISRNNISNYVLSSAQDSGRLPVEQVISSVNTKLNLQLTANNSGEIFFMWNDKKVEGRGFGVGRPWETARNQSGPGHIIKLEDTHIFSQNLYLTGLYSQIKNGYQQSPIGGTDVEAYWTEGDDETPSSWHRSYAFFKQNVPQKNARLDGAGFVKTGSINHELKFGFGYRDTPAESVTAWPGNGTFGNFYDGYALAALTRPALPNFGSRYSDFYLGDTVIVGDLTLVGGFRYDLQKARNFGSSVPANVVVPDLLPAVDYAGDERALEWKGLSPRLGATWALGPEKKTVVRASYNRYMDQLGSSDVGPSNPFYLVQMLYYYWDDANNDKTVQRNEIDFDSGVYSWDNIDPDNPGAAISTGRLDYGMKPTTTDEFVLGVEHELMPDFAVGVSYSYRNRNNFVWNQYEKTRGSNNFYTKDDYEQAGVVRGTLPDGTAYEEPYYRLKAGLSSPVYYVTTNRPDYHQTYQGVELTATKRMSNRWMMRGNVTLSSWKQHVGENGFVDPTRILDGDSCSNCDGSIVASNGGSGGYINSRWSYSLNAAYELPWSFQVGASVVGREGYVIPYFHRSPRVNGATKDVLVSDEFGSSRLDNLFNVDLRLSREFRVRNVGIDLSLDLFNVTDERTPLWRTNRLQFTSSGVPNASNNQVEEFMSPRVWRLGARLNF